MYEIVPVVNNWVGSGVVTKGEKVKVYQKM